MVFVLIVDDERQFVIFLTRWLQAGGLRGAECHRRQRAIAKEKTRGDRIAHRSSTSESTSA
jgi:ActR/RegA family two-component response regulator